MDFQSAVRRVTQPPIPLPGGDRSIDPVLLGTPDSLPGWTRMERGATRRAAGLVLLFPDELGAARVVLTERPDGLRHAGQVSLPGGKEEVGDDFPDGTALREAFEEVGLDIDQAGVTILGRLDVVDVRVSGFMLTPVVAAAKRAPALTGSPREVAAILLPPVDLFLPGARVTTVDQERDGYRIRYGGYPFEGRHIWGATARALAQLGAILGADPSLDDRSRDDPLNDDPLNDDR
ncbi:MAG: CoA pyrophosphatase [Chloroflexi bacterium]|nr:CoA pyrophosphatase [Chloroflexota bacterium]